MKPFTSAGVLGAGRAATVRLEDEVEGAGRCGRAGGACVDVHVKLLAGIPGEDWNATDYGSRWSRERFAGRADYYFIPRSHPTASARAAGGGTPTPADAADQAHDDGAGAFDRLRSPWTSRSPRHQLGEVATPRGCPRADAPAVGTHSRMAPSQTATASAPGSGCPSAGRRGSSTGPGAASCPRSPAPRLERPRRPSQRLGPGEADTRRDGEGLGGWPQRVEHRPVAGCAPRPGPRRPSSPLAGLRPSRSRRGPAPPRPAPGTPRTAARRSRRGHAPARRPARRRGRRVVERERRERPQDRPRPAPG